VKVVAVSQRVDVFSDRNESRDALDQRLVDFLLSIDCLAYPVPNSYGRVSDLYEAAEKFTAWIDLVSPDAILLSGGNNIGQCSERDLTETWLAEYAQKNKLPLLGICRGMQMLAHLSGSLLSDVSGHVATRHVITGEISAEVNSYHNLGFKSTPDGYKVLAIDETGVVEAIRHLHLPWEGWMWHPERETPFVDGDINRARILFDA
jgi:N5-(cytidine 5'-diphosphoramidyl)-L-glutamine hydrolase